MTAIRIAVAERRPHGRTLIALAEAEDMRWPRPGGFRSFRARNDSGDYCLPANRIALNDDPLARACRIRRGLDFTTPAASVPLSELLLKRASSTSSAPRVAEPTCRLNRPRATPDREIGKHESWCESARRLVVRRAGAANFDVEILEMHHR